MADPLRDHVFGVVVLSYGDGPARTCVDALLSGGLAPEQVLVVHNPSRADEGAPVLPIGVGVRVMEGNIGYGAAMNVGMRYWRDQGCAVALLCTHDVQITTHTADALVRVVLDDPTVAACGPVLQYSDGTIISAGGRVTRLGDIEQRQPTGAGAVPVGWLDGSIIAIDLAPRVEFMEDFFLYWEDVAFGVDLRAAGYRLECLESERAISRPGAGDREALFIYLHWRNRLGFAVRRKRVAMAVYSATKLLVALTRHLLLNDLRLARRRVGSIYTLALVHGLSLRLGRPPTTLLRGTDVH